MTELLDGDGGRGREGRRLAPEDLAMGVRVAADGSPTAVRTSAGWRRVVGTVNRWIVETDWWRAPVRREYRRCLVTGGDCLELCRELDGPGGWTVVRRYD